MEKPSVGVEHGVRVDQPHKVLLVVPQYRVHLGLVKPFLKRRDDETLPGTLNAMKGALSRQYRGIRMNGHGVLFLIPIDAVDGLLSQTSEHMRNLKIEKVSAVPNASDQSVPLCMRSVHAGASVLGR